MVTYNIIKSAFSRLELTDVPVIAHASLRSFGEVEGGAPMVVQAMLASFKTIIMPTHTYKPMVVPSELPPDSPFQNPPNNAMKYGEPDPTNPHPEFFTLDMPSDKLMGIIPETLREHPRAKRSMHPILSFAGVNATEILASQTLKDPFAPIRMLADQNGWVLLIGVDHTSNTSIHFAEQLAGRKTFIRWAMVRDDNVPNQWQGPTKQKHLPSIAQMEGLHERIVECPNFPGCSMGFQAIAPDVEASVRRTKAGKCEIIAVPLATIIYATLNRIRRDPEALLCFDPKCARCNATRESIKPGK